MRVLVTGGAGFLGRAMVAALRAEGADVVVPGLDRPRVDLTDDNAVEALIAEAAAETLVHAAWYSGDDRIHAAQNADWIDHTTRLVESFLSAGGRRVVTIGTCFEYELLDGPLTEAATPIRPHTAYGRAKAEMADTVASVCADHGATACHGRVGFVYGPGEVAPRLVPALLESLAAGERFATTAGTQQRDYLYVADVARAVALLAADDIVGPVNIGSGAAIAVADLIGAFAHEVGGIDLVDFGALSMRAGDPDRIELSIQRLRALGWQPEVPLLDGVRRTILAITPDLVVPESKKEPPRP